MYSERSAPVQAGADLADDLGDPEPLFGGADRQPGQPAIQVGPLVR